MKFSTRFSIKKLIFVFSLLINFAVFAYDPALDEAEALYRQAEKLTTEYIASFKTLKTLAAKDLTTEQRADIDAIINNNEKGLKNYQTSLHTLKKLMSDYNKLSDGERSAALNAVSSQTDSLKVLVNSLQNALELNKAAIENYEE